MDTEKSSTVSPEFSAFNYCTCFIDILGQRHALSDQGLLPMITTEQERLKFIQEILTKTIRPITRLQNLASQLVAEARSPTESPIRRNLPLELREEWDKIQGHELQLQYWSDGLVAFTRLGNMEIPNQINGVFTLLHMAGSLCFMNLSNTFRNPLRGGIEIAWGTELSPGMLYGPAIARAYELESEVAQYPRIVVGKRMIEFLKAIAELEPMDNYSRYSSSVAKKCLQMLGRDIDGQWIIHYLGEAFLENVPHETYNDMYNEALQFVSKEYERFRSEGDTKLSIRYFHLLSYFQSHSPKPSMQLTEG